MKAGKLQSLIMSVFGCFYAFVAYSATSLFSDYGQIQNVQNYSTNPFWSPTTPYNQKLPQPVYVQGVNITTEECIQVVQSAVAFQCAARNNCINTALSDIRPSIIVQLSNLPGKAYSTACAGYLDTVFESYVAQYGNYAPKQRVGLPQATVPNPAINNNNTIQIQNPYEVKPSREEQEIIDRTQELENLQRQNGSGVYGLHAMDSLPGTIADVSLEERLSNAAEGYEPYAGKSAYKTITTQNDFSKKAWCETHNDPACPNYRDPNQPKTQQQNAQNTSASTANAQKGSGTQNANVATNQVTKVTNKYKNIPDVPESDRIYSGFICENNKSIDGAITAASIAAIVLPLGAASKAATVAAKAATSAKIISGLAGFATKFGLKGLVLAGAGTAALSANNVINADQEATPEASDLYSYFNSDANPDVINCKDLDPNEGCYTVCGQSGPQDEDDLNQKVFKPIFGRTYCVNPNNYTLQDTKTNELLTMSSEQMQRVNTSLRNQVVEQGFCTKNEDDIDFYFGHFIIDSNNNGKLFKVDDIIRLDD